MQNRHEKKLLSIVKKEIKRVKKRIDVGADDLPKLNKLKDVVETQRRFNILSVDNDSDIKLVKETDSETITIDFDSWNPNDDDEELQLFDVIIRKKYASASNYLVFTCSAYPVFGHLSVRMVPIDINFLDQTIYDGPDISIISENLQVCDN
jgi:hypothetical protein